MLQVRSSSNPFDVVVVGSGATGGWAAKQLTEAGMKVVLLEAGKKITPKDFTEHVMPWQTPFLGMSPKIIKDRPVQGRCYACTEYNYEWFVNDKDNPYEQVKPFSWIRQRVWGRTGVGAGRATGWATSIEGGVARWLWG